MPVLILGKATAVSRSRRQSPVSGDSRKRAVRVPHRFHPSDWSGSMKDGFTDPTIEERRFVLIVDDDVNFKRGDIGTDGTNRCQRGCLIHVPIVPGVN